MSLTREQMEETLAKIQKTIQHNREHLILGYRRVIQDAHNVLLHIGGKYDLPTLAEFFVRMQDLKESVKHVDLLESGIKDYLAQENDLLQKLNALLTAELQHKDAVKSHLAEQVEQGTSILHDRARDKTRGSYSNQVQPGEEEGTPDWLETPHADEGERCHCGEVHYNG